MLESLLNLVREHSADLIVKNPAIPDEQNDSAVTEIAQSIASGLQHAIAQGSVQSVLGLLNGQTRVQGHPVVNDIAALATARLSTRSGVSAQTASSVAAVLVPIVMKQLVSRTNDPRNNSFDLTDIFSALTGGRSHGLDLEQLAAASTSSVSPSASPGFTRMIEELRSGADTAPLDVKSVAETVFGSIFRGLQA